MFFELKLVLIIVLLYAHCMFGEKNMQPGCQAFPQERYNGKKLLRSNNLAEVKRFL